MTDWIKHIGDLRENYLQTDPQLIAFIVRDWEITEKSGLKDLAWAMCQDGYITPNDSKFLLDKLEEFIKEKNMTEKIIIENQTNMPMSEAIFYVIGVIKQGRISNNGKQYCYCTKWKDGTVVVTDLNKKSDRFVIYNDSTKI